MTITNTREALDFVNVMLTSFNRNDLHFDSGEGIEVRDLVGLLIETAGMIQDIYNNHLGPEAAKADILRYWKSSDCDSGENHAIGFIKSTFELFKSPLESLDDVADEWAELYND